MEVFGYVVHETVEFVPAKLVVEVLKREKLACRTTGCKGDVATAPRAETPSVATRLGASSLAFLVETKCDDGMPLYRIADQFKRLGYDIPVNTLYSAWSYALDLLKPVADTVLSETLGNDVVAVDDTSMPVLNTTKGGTRSKGHLWGFWGSTTKSIAYAFSPTWSAQEVATFFAGIDGFIQVDDYKGYASKLKRGDPNSPVVVDPDRRPSSTQKSSMMHAASILRGVEASRYACGETD
jgi:transposase